MPTPLEPVVEQVLEDGLRAWEAGALPPVAPAVLRLVRTLPSLASRLDPVLTDPLERALTGLGAPEEVDVGDDLARAVLVARARADAGVLPSAAGAAALEGRAQGDKRWWVPAARLHVRASPDRERAARMALSIQELPYAFPGELHPLQVDLLAAGDRVLPALHVEQVRRLTSFALDTLTADLRSLGFWFWPLLRVFAESRLRRPLTSARVPRRAAPGAIGLLEAYRRRIDLDPGADLTEVALYERFVWALTIAADRPVT